MSAELFPVATISPRGLAVARPPEDADSVLAPRTSPLAAAAAVCALLGFLNAAGFAAGAVLGHLALVRIRRSGGRLRGRRLALAAVAVSWTPIVTVAVVFVAMFLIGLDVTAHGS